MSLEKIPPVIAALDCDTIRGVNDLVDRLQSDELGPDLLGFKIPHWFDQHERLKRRLVEDGNYVVLDTQTVNAANKMALATKAFMKKRVLPSAITIAPALGPSDPDMAIIQNVIVPTTAKHGVDIIGFAEQTNSDTGSDNAIMHEARRYMNGQVAGFSGHEVHAANIISDKFQEEIDLSIRATFRGIDTKPHEVTIEWPDLVVSKFDIPDPRTHWPAEDTYFVSERVVRKPEAEKIGDPTQRIAKIAGGVFALDPRVRSVYLGTSVIENDDPVSFILNVLEHREKALQADPKQVRAELQAI